MRKSSKPTVRNLILYEPDILPNSLQDTRVGTPQWRDWLTRNSAFAYEGKAGHFSAKKELRHEKTYWYAYRRRDSRLYSAYLGKSDELNAERLEQVCVDLSGKNPRFQISNPVEPQPAVAGLQEGSSLLSLNQIRPPALPRKLVSRQRLTSKINMPVTLIYAPSGFGKSTLLNEWRQQCNLPVVWLTLRSNDNQLTHFWSSFSTAFQGTPGLNLKILPYLQVPSASEIPDMLRQLSDEIFKSSTSLAIVLDDFHHIRQSKVVGLIQPWLENIPSQVRLIIASRVKPPFSLGHLRAEGKLTELDMSDLRFTVNEGMLFLENYFQDDPLLHEEMEMLVKRTDGWATGLTLAVLALNKQDDRRTFISSFNGSHTYLREFFMESVLQQQPRPVQSFLLKTAILKNLTGSLCDVLTGENNGAEMLSWLWNENLFITRSEEQDWYHYNDLFAEMLQDQLQKQLPDQIPGLHRKAAIWYSQKYVLEEALYHLFTIQAWEEAASLIETLALREIEQLGEDSRLLRWLRQLPETVVQQHKTLLFLYVRLASGAMNPAEVNRYLSTIEQNIINKPENERTANEQEVLSEIRRIKLLSVTGYPLQSQLSTGGEHDATWQLLSQLSLVVKSLYFKNEPYSEQQVFKVYEAARLQKNLFVLILAGSSLVKISYLRGELRHSEKLANSILQQAYASRGKLPETASVLMASLSQIYFAWNQLERAKQALTRAIDIDPNPTSTNVTMLVSILRAKILAAEGKNEEARSVMENAREFHLRRPSGTWSEQELTAYQAWFRLRDGDTAGAAQLLTAIEGADLNNIPDLVQAEIFLSLNQPATSEDILNRILDQRQDRLHYEPFLIARIMLSIALFKLHRVNESQQLIMELLRNAAIESFIRPFIDFETYLTPILKLVLHTNNLSAQTRSFVQKILILSGYSDEVLETRDSEVLDLVVSASITPREQQIMHLVAEGLSNGEIALRLSIAESTVKTHLANVYLKLGASSRMQAVGRMKALNLS